MRIQFRQETRFRKILMGIAIAMIAIGIIGLVT